MDKCKYCSSSDFININDTLEYSGIEVSLNRKGVMRIRTYPQYHLEVEFDSQDVIVLKYCPMCGRKFNK